MKVKNLTNKGLIIILLVLMILSTGLYAQNRSVELSSFSAQLSEDTIELFWVTESETNNIGWNIYRSVSDDFQNAFQINESLIPGAGTTTEQTAYEYVDDYGLIQGNTYYYWLESTNYNGVTESFGSINIFFPLPVDLISFNAAYIFPDFIYVTWSTASESNLNYFGIYRNDVLIHQAGATNSSEIVEYLFVDTEIEIGETYVYDLVVVCLDGTSFNIGSTTVSIGYPVILSSFDAIYENNILTLYWITQAETNVFGWNIYRSDTVHFDNAYQINANIIPGAGTTTEPTEYEYIDEKEIVQGNTYWYWIEATQESGYTTTFGPAFITIPQTNIEQNQSLYYETQLLQNHPNPFRKNTIISYSLDRNTTSADLFIYNIKGQLVRYHSINPGIQKGAFTWDGTDDSNKKVSAGIYLYRLQTDEFSTMKKMILME